MSSAVAVSPDASSSPQHDKPNPVFTRRGECQPSKHALTLAPMGAQSTGGLLAVRVYPTATKKT